MVDGISGVGAGVNVDLIKELVQEAVEEALDARETKNASSVEETPDEEPAIDDSGSNADSKEPILYKDKVIDHFAEEEKNNQLTAFTGLLSAISVMMTSMMETMMKMLGIGQTGQTPAQDGAENIKTEGTTNEPHVYTRAEQEFLEEYEYYLKNIIAEEKLTTDPDVAKFFLGSDLSWDEKVATVANSVTEAEIDAYLQENPDAIQKGILESANWSKSTKFIHKGNLSSVMQKYY